MADAGADPGGSKASVAKRNQEFARAASAAASSCCPLSLPGSCDSRLLPGYLETTEHDPSRPSLINSTTTREPSNWPALVLFNGHV